MNYDFMSRVGKTGRICTVSCEKDSYARDRFSVVTQNDKSHFTDLTEEEQKMAIRWLRYNIIPTSTPCEEHSSYGMKHVLEDRTKIYMTNNQFKEAMLRCGFFPVHTDELNWIFCISKKSPIFTEQADKRDGLPMLGYPMDYSTKEKDDAEWVSDSDGLWHCGKCGYHPVREASWEEDDSVPLYHFCPNCGAKMKIKKEV